MDLSPRLISSTKLEDIKPMRKTKRTGSQKKLNNNVTYSIQQIAKLATTLLLQRIHIFIVLDKPYIELL